MSKVAPNPEPAVPSAEEGTGKMMEYGDVKPTAKKSGMRQSLFKRKADSDILTEDKGSVWWTLENLRMSQAHFIDNVSVFSYIGLLPFPSCTP
jgi:hypothetical protein